jgi:hypothetical protein
MGRPMALAAILLAATPAAAAQFDTPANPPDPAAQLAEMIALYDAVCLRAFPDDAAVAREMAARGAVMINPSEPLAGWVLTARTARFQFTIEPPPSHSCSVSTITVAGFPDMAPYRALADRFEAGGGYRAAPARSAIVVHILIASAGDRREIPGGTESLMVTTTRPDDQLRDAAHSAVEIRFVHRFSTSN